VVTSSGCHRWRVRHRREGEEPESLLGNSQFINPFSAPVSNAHSHSIDQSVMLIIVSSSSFPVTSTLTQACDNSCCLAVTTIE
jgi:hypothetical protein